MKLSKPLSALILIASVLLLNAKNGVSRSEKHANKVETNSNESRATGDPIATPINQRATEKADDHGGGVTYNYNGTFKYVAPPTPPEGGWKKFGDIATVASTIAVAFFTGMLWYVSKRQKELMEKAEETSRRSVELTALALNADRPYLFVEQQDIGMYLHMTVSIVAPLIGAPTSVAEDPKHFLGVDESNRADVRFAFDLRNHGKGPAIIRDIRVRMLLGRGLYENEDSRLVTIGREDAVIHGGRNLTGPDERAGCSVSGLSLLLDTLVEITEWKRSLRFVILVAYSDVYDQRFTRTFPFEYRAAMKSAISGLPSLGPMLIPAFKKSRRRYR